jgi:L-lactate dehydrogenase complex protein LldE
MVRILENLGIKVFYNTSQTCCGQAAFNGGHWDIARELAVKYLDDFNGSRPIVSPSASCTSYVKNYFPDLLENTIYMNNYRKLKSNMFEFSDFLVNQIGISDLGAKFEAKVTIHDACAAIREYGLKDEPRKLLRNVAGLEIVEMEESDTCCGFGGTFAAKFEAISTAMADQKAKNASATGADYMVTTEASCIMHMDAYFKQQNLPIRCLHIADILVNFDQGKLFYD